MFEDLLGSIWGFFSGFTGIIPFIGGFFSGISGIVPLIGGFFSGIPGIIPLNELIAQALILIGVATLISQDLRYFRRPAKITEESQEIVLKRQKKSHKLFQKLNNVFRKKHATHKTDSGVRLQDSKSTGRPIKTTHSGSKRRSTAAVKPNTRGLSVNKNRPDVIRQERYANVHTSRNPIKRIEEESDDVVSDEANDVIIYETGSETFQNVVSDEYDEIDDVSWSNQMDAPSSDYDDDLLAPSGECDVEMKLLQQDNDNIRELNDVLLKENVQIKKEVSRLKRENEELANEKEDLMRLLAEIRLGRSGSFRQEDDVTDAPLPDLQRRSEEDPENLDREICSDPSIVPDYLCQQPPSDEMAQRQQPLGASSDSDTTQPFSTPEVPQSTSPEADDRNKGDEPTVTFQIVFVGDSGVGKTTFIRQLCRGIFRPTFNATIGIDFLMKSMTLDGQHLTLQFWDTAGQERYRSLAKQYFRKADAVVVMYDVTSETSFKNVRGWMSSVEEGRQKEETVVAIVGNKRDLVSDDTDGRAVTTADGATLAKECNAMFYECSAKTGQGISDIIEDMSRMLLQRSKLEESSRSKESSNISLNTASGKRRRSDLSCCKIS